MIRQTSSDTAPPTKPLGDPTVKLMHDIAQLSIDYAETRWRRALLLMEIRARAIVRIAWFALLALPSGLLAAFFAAHAVAQLLVEWGLSPFAAYGLTSFVLGGFCAAAVFVAKRTAEKWLK
jgi:hypothetical protein